MTSFKSWQLSKVSGSRETAKQCKMTQDILKLRKLTKVFSNQVVALDSVNFSVKPGEFVAVIGLSGSGKSTLLKCINHVTSPTSGEILFRNQDLVQAQGETLLKIRKKIAMIFQGYNLISRHSVLNNTLMGSLSEISSLKSIFGLFTQAQISEATEFLRLVGIEEKMNVRASNLSGGQQQRVAIARALMQKPEILLADEPVASLDPKSADTVMRYLKFVNQKLSVTVVCNLHYLSLVREYGTRVIGLKAGRIVFDGRPDEISDEIFQNIYGESLPRVDFR